MKSKLIKTALAFSALSASALVGDCYDIRDRFLYPAYYREVLIADGFYKRPFNLRKEYRVNESGYLEVYFGDREMYPVAGELRVNERKLGVMLKDGAEDLVRRGREGLGRAVDSLKEIYGSGADEE